MQGEHNLGGPSRTGPVSGAEIVSQFPCRACSPKRPTEHGKRGIGSVGSVFGVVGRAGKSGLTFAQRESMIEHMRKKKGSRMGRPPKPPGLKQSQMISVHVTPAERERMEAEATRRGISLSALLASPWRKEP